MKCAAICLAAGQGKRMGSSVQKQFLLLNEKPVLYYSLKALQDSFIEEIILVVSENEIEYCKKEIVEKYSFSKVTQIVAGGKERYHSVFQGLTALQEAKPEYVFIHDGARPFIDQEILERGLKGVETYEACVIGMPVKDTIKIADEDGNCLETPARDRVWMIQTPQIFVYTEITEAYSQLIEAEKVNKSIPKVTDDAMVAEYFLQKKIHFVKGSYENIKLTTPEDLEIAKAFLKKQKK